MPLHWRARQLAHRLTSLGAAAAILREITDQRIHHRKISCVKQLPAQAALRNKTRSLQVLQMEREGGGHKSHPACNRAGGEPLRTSLNQQPVYGESMLVGESTQGIDDLWGSHARGTILRERS
jgi:hypothetical protein